MICPSGWIPTVLRNSQSCNGFLIAPILLCPRPCNPYRGYKVCNTNRKIFLWPHNVQNPFMRSFGWVLMIFSDFEIFRVFVQPNHPRKVGCFPKNVWFSWKIIKFAKDFHEKSSFFFQIPKWKKMHHPKKKKFFFFTQNH